MTSMRLRLPELLGRFWRLRFLSHPSVARLPYVHSAAAPADAGDPDAS